MPMLDALTLRDAEASDDAFLLALFAGTRAAEFAPFGWPVALDGAFMRRQFEAQRGDYQRRHPASRCQVIEMHVEPVGRLWLAQDAHGVAVLDISLVEARRGQGIGSDCLRRVQRQAAAAGLDVTLQVVLDNPAKRLYERLGFHDVGRGDVRQSMVWKSIRSAPLPSTAPLRGEPA